MELKLRGLMIGIASLALITTVVIQSVRLREAVIREQRLRAELERQRAVELLRQAYRVLEDAGDARRRTTARWER